MYQISNSNGESMAEPDQSVFSVPSDVMDFADIVGCGGSFEQSEYQ